MENKQKNSNSFRGNGKGKQHIPRNNRSQLQVCTLSGTSSIGGNCNFIEYENDIAIVDFGFSFPDHDLYGIDHLIPNIKYLKKNKSKIKGIYITHAHLDHIGGLRYILKDLDFPPIYGTRFSIAMVQEKLREANLGENVKYVTVRAGDEVSAGKLKVRFIRVNHSIPQSSALFIQSPKGNIFISGDYKIDTAPANEPETDYEGLKALRGKIDVALMESTNVHKPGKAPSESEIARNLEKVIVGHDGRIILAAFASLVTRLYSVITIAHKHGKKVALSGRGIDTIMKIIRSQKYVDVPEEIFVDIRKLKNVDQNNLIILVTGSQGERYAALNRISLREHLQVKATKGDLIVLSASAIPGNESKIEKMTDRLLRMDVDLLQNKEMAIHSSGHGYQDDMKMMYDMIQPKSVMPVHGSLSYRYHHKKLLKKWGYSEQQVHLTEDGQIWKLNGNKFVKGTKVESKPIMIDGLGVGDIGDLVIKNRQQLAEYGMFSIVMNLSKKSHSMIGRPKFVSRGFVYMKTSQELLREIETIVVDIHRSWQINSKEKNRFEYKALKGTIEKTLYKFIKKKTEREPIILPVII